MKRLIVTLFFILAASASVQATEVTLQDFARMMPLTLAGTGALHEMSLPYEVYISAKRSDLGDLAVFNGTGEIVPFTLLKPSLIQTSSVGRELPLFPLTGSASRRQGSIAMQVRTDDHGAIVNLTTTPGAASPAAIIGYIVDATALDKPIIGFDVGLTPLAQGFIGAVQVESSDDLQLWRRHASGVVAALSEGEKQLSKDRIEFSAIKARYFRLSIVPCQGAPQINKVVARLETFQALPSRESERFVITPVKGKSGEYMARTNGYMPVDRLRLVFLDENSLAGVTFLSRMDDKSPWIERGSGMFYSLRRDATVVSGRPLEISPASDREWLIRVRQPAAGLGSRVPQLEVGWQPHRLVFAARGDAPFRLAYGSVRTGLDSLRDDGIAAGLASWERQQIKPLPIVPGASLESGGKKALKPRVPATNWRKVLLWGALLSGVLLLAGMVWRLLKEMGLNDARNK